MSIDSMNANLTNPKNDIERYSLKEVTSIRSFVSNTTMLDPEGLFSEDIFGKQGTIDRKTKWGYIELNATFMNPHAFYVFSRLKRTIANDIKNGVGRYYIDKDGELQSIDITKETLPTTALSKAGTGLDWLKSVWPKISWRVTKSMSSMAKILRTFMQTRSVDQIFWEQFLVMPAFYRDIDPKTNKRNKINTYYSKALRLAQVIKSSRNLVFMDDPSIPCISSAQIKLQDTINEFYVYFMDKIGGTHGFVNENVLGKSTDYGARLVISTPDFNTNSYKDIETDFFHSSVPLSVAINIFAPFIIYGLTQFIRSYISGNQYVTYWDMTKSEFVKAEIDPTYMSEFTPDAIRKYMDNYKKSKTYRINAVTIKGANKTRIPISIYYNDIEKDHNIYIDKGAVASIDPKEMVNHTRYLTWCELFYIVAEDTLKQKVIYNTRYPLTTYNNTYCSLMNIIAANQYQPIFFRGVEYKRYPKLSIEQMSDTLRLFTDTMRMCSVYLDAMGADYDGDQISTQGLFANEGNKDAVDHMKSVSNIVGINSASIREFPHVVKHGIYGLTFKTYKPESK